MSLKRRYTTEITQRNITSHFHLNFTELSGSQREEYEDGNFQCYCYEQLHIRLNVSDESVVKLMRILQHCSSSFYLKLAKNDVSKEVLLVSLGKITHVH